MSITRTDGISNQGFADHPVETLGTASLGVSPFDGYTLAESEQGFPFPSKRELGTFFSCNQQNAPTITIDGVTYHNTEMLFYGNGQLKGGYLIEDTLIDGILYKADNIIAYHEDGQVIGGILAEDTSIDGVTYKANTQIVFHKNRKVMEGTPAVDALIDGILYQADTPIARHENGQVKQGILAAGNDINGTLYPEGTQIWRDEAGQIEKIILSEDWTINQLTFSGELIEVPYKADEKILIKNGQPIMGTLAEDTLIDGILCRAKYEKNDKSFREIYFHDNRRLKKCRLAERTEDPGKKGVYYKPGTWLERYDNGQVYKGRLDGIVPIDGVKYFFDIEYYPDGRVKTGSIGEEYITIQGREFFMGNRISFDENGRVEN